MDSQFIQLVALCLVPLLQGKDIEFLDVDATVKKAVEIAKAAAQEINAMMEGEGRGN